MQSKQSEDPQTKQCTEGIWSSTKYSLSLTTVQVGDL